MSGIGLISAAFSSPMGLILAPLYPDSFFGLVVKVLTEHSPTKPPPLTTHRLPLNQSTVSLSRRLFRECLRPHLKKVIIAVICMTIGAAANAGYAWLMDPVVNKIFTQREADALWWLASIVLGTFFTKSVANYFEAVLLSQVGLRIIADLQSRLFAQIMRLDAVFFHHNTTGSLLSRMTNDIGAMRFAASDALTGAGKDASSVIFLIGVMFYQDWVLSAATFFVFPLAIYPIVRMGKRMRKVTANTQEHMGHLVTYLEQSIQGVRLVKSYGMEQYEVRRVQGLINTVQDLIFRAARVRSASSPVMEFLGGFAVTVVILYGGSRVIDGHTTPGAFFSFITALMMAYRPLKSIGSLNNSLQEGLAAAARTFSILDLEPSIVDRPGAVPLQISHGEVRFDNVFFTYDGQRVVLDGLSVAAPGGSTIALVGSSGAGKSTLLNLLPRFYDVTDGAVTIDGQDIRHVSLASLRTNVALVSQEIVLFDDSIRANIAYGNFGATDDEIEAAAQSAAAHDFIMELPHGYQTVVGERGMSLSGGQRQRIAIARAMLKNAPILLLDEATSALDTESERQVQSALERLMQGRTTIVIAHRLSTVTHADVIHVMDAGRVIESGSHEQLLAAGGAYAHLYDMQFAHEQPAP